MAMLVTSWNVAITMEDLILTVQMPMLHSNKL